MFDLDKITIFLLGMCALINLYSTQPILKQLASQLDISISIATLTISETTLGVAVLSPFAGSVSDHLGRKKIMVNAILIMLLATFLCILSSSFAVFLADDTSLEAARKVTELYDKWCESKLGKFSLDDIIYLMKNTFTEHKNAGFKYG